MVEGTQVGAYRVLHRIGSGGMGTVYLAEHAMLGRRAAIKMLKTEYSVQPNIVNRFFNEAKAATAISDPGIVQIFDFGHHTDGSAYIVMELLEGETLDDRLERGGPMPVADALRIMRQVASSLGAAHARQIVHRDLKPENIFIVRDPEVAGGERAKIVDFGIAKILGDTNVKTKTSAVLGTPLYMSPEQCRGAGLVDQRSDVYALGCVLFKLITGRPPFDSEGMGDIIAMHLREPPPVPSMYAPGLPHVIDHFVLRCLAKDPAHRPANGTELAAEIGALLGSSPSLPNYASSYATGPRAALAPTSATTLSAATGVSSVSHPAPRPRTRLLVIGAVAVTVVGATLGVITAHGSGDPDKPTGSVVEAPPPAPAPPVAAAPAPPPPPAKPTPEVEATPLIKETLARFVAWSKDHAGAPCPDEQALGGAIDDPWGHPITLTCTDQPADQIVGAISTGPDGKPGGGDDISSWQLGRDVTELVRGARWTANKQGVPVKHGPPKFTPSTPHPRPPVDDIPAER